jgi:hypothetical protein
MPISNLPAVRGELLPGDPGWDDARRAFNLTVDQQPATVLSVASVDEIVAAVRSAARRGLRISVQATGHGAASLAPLDDALLLRTGALRDVEIDAAARLVTFEPGALAQEVVEAAATHGLAVPAGFARTVGMTGFALGGGIGWLARRRGLAAHAIVAVELVTADGRLRRVDLEHDPELLWALRGGGGRFGVVTRMSMRLEPLVSVHGGALFWPVERAEEVLTRWVELTGALPDNVTSVGRLLSLPPLPEVPEPLRGKTWCVVESVHATDGAEHDRLLAPLRALDPVIDTVGPLPVAELGRLHGDPELPLPVAGDHLLLGALDTDAVRAFVAAGGPPLVNAELRHLGGALARASADDGPIGALDARFALHAMGMAPDAASEAVSEDRLAALRCALSPWDTGRVLANLTERPTPAERIYSPAALDRLRAVARRVDPEGRFA